MPVCVFPSYVYLGYLPCYVYVNDIFTEWWSRPPRGSGKLNVFPCLTVIWRALQNFLRIFSLDFSIHWWNLCEFLEIKNVTNLKTSVSTIIRNTLNLREESGNHKKSNMPWRCMCKLDNCLNWLSIIFLSVLDNQVDLCYQGRRPFWTCRMLLLNSKIGPISPQLI